MTRPALAEATDFTRQVLGNALVYPLSARASLDGGDPGFDAFAADFRSYLAGKRVTDLRSSAVARARRIAGSLLDEVALTRRAAQLAAGDAAERVTQFGERLSEVAVRGRDAVAVVNAESARELRALNDAAEADGHAPGRGRLPGSFATSSTANCEDASPAEIERLGRERLVAITLDAAGAWHERRRQLIEDGLAQADARLADELRKALEVLRDSATQLLGLNLAVPEPGSRLTEDRRFFYTTAEDVGQTELLAGAVRRKLPGELGRRRAREHLLREAQNLVTAQIGRARGDLQYRLSEATRAMARIIQQRYDDSTGRMQAALRAAEVLRNASSSAAAEKESELSARSAALRHILALLDEIG